MKPPKYIIRLLDHCLKNVYADEIIGDLYEWFEIKSPKTSSLRLHIYALKVIAGSLKLRKLKSLPNILQGLINTTMGNNQLKMSLKSLFAHKVFTAINLIGLTVSFVAFLFIYSYISYEKSFDQFHANKDNIYRVIKKYSESGELVRSTPTPLANAFQRHFDGAISFARFGQDPVIAKVDQQKYYEENFFWGDGSIFTTFTIPFKYGNPKHVLKEPNTVVLSASAAHKYFGDINPVGKILDVRVYDGDTNFGLRVDGVFEDLPTNSDLPFEMVGSMQNALSLYSQFNKSWGFNWLHTYAVIEETDLPRIQAGIPSVIEAALGEEYISQISFYFQPLDEVHLYSSEISGSKTSGNANYVLTLSFIALLTIIIAAFNYLNMMASTVNKRRKYVAINKILGASKQQLFSQFLLESFLAIVISFIGGYLLVSVLWPFYQSLVDKPIPFTQTYELRSVATYLLIMVTTCLIASLQPAVLLSKIKGNTSAIRDNVKQKNQFQKILVGSQFAIAVFLICSTVTIFRQVQFATSESLGFDSEQLLSIKVEDRQLQTKISEIKNEFLQIPGVESATLSGESLPSQMNNTDLLYWNEESKEKSIAIHELSAENNFFKVLNIQLLEGRTYFDNNTYQNESEVVINEAARDFLGSDFKINDEITIGPLTHQVVGVVENYHYSSFKSKIDPVVYFQTTAGSRLSYDNILLRVSGKNLSNTIESMEKVWNTYSSNEFFTFHFVDQTYEELYQSDQKFLTQFSIFAGLSVIITCLGLLGMMLFMADQRAKEISVRKVLGSTQFGIISLILRQFIYLISVGLVIGLPIAIYFGSNWKQQFIYQIPFTLMDFIIPALIILGFSLLTIGRSAFKISGSDPVRYLRNE